MAGLLLSNDFQTGIAPNATLGMAAALVPTETTTRVLVALQMPYVGVF